MILSRGTQFYFSIGLFVLFLVAISTPWFFIVQTGNSYDDTKVILFGFQFSYCAGHCNAVTLWRSSSYCHAAASSSCTSLTEVVDSSAAFYGLSLGASLFYMWSMYTRHQATRHNAAVVIGSLSRRTASVRFAATFITMVVLFNLISITIFAAKVPSLLNAIGMCSSCSGFAGSSPVTQGISTKWGPAGWAMALTTFVWSLFMMYALWDDYRKSRDGDDETRGSDYYSLGSQHGVSAEFGGYVPPVAPIAGGTRTVTTIITRGGMPPGGVVAYGPAAHQYGVQPMYAVGASGITNNGQLAVVSPPQGGGGGGQQQPTQQYAQQPYSTAYAYTQQSVQPQYGQVGVPYAGANNNNAQFGPNVTPSAPAYAATGREHDGSASQQQPRKPAQPGVYRPPDAL